MTPSRIFLAMTAALGSSTGSAHAVPIEVSFSATISEVHALVASEFSVGGPVSGSFTIEHTTPDGYPFAGVGEYLATGAVSWTFDGHTVSDEDWAVVIWNGFDQQDAYTFGAHCRCGEAVNGFIPVTFHLFLSDPTQTAFDTDHLPRALRLEDFATATVGLAFEGTNGFWVTASVTSIEVVPEPAIGALLALALLARVRSSGSAARRRPALPEGDSHGRSPRSSQPSVS